MLNSSDNQSVSHSIDNEDGDSTDEHSHRLGLPGILSTDDSHTDDELSTSKDDDRRVTAQTRQQYLTLLERTLRNNYRKQMNANNADGRPVNESTINDLAMYLELKALKRCLVFPLYQNAVFEMVHEIRRETIKQRPYRRDKMGGSIKRGKSRDVTTMTADLMEVTSTTGKLDVVHVIDDDSSEECCAIGPKPLDDEAGQLSLDARIEDFERRLDAAKQTVVRCNLIRSRDIQSPAEHTSPANLTSATGPTSSKRLRVDSQGSQATILMSPAKTPTAKEIIVVPDDDELTKELNALFSSDAESDIFSDTNNPQIEAIFLEIDRFDPNLIMECQTESQMESEEMSQETLPCENPSPRMHTPAPAPKPSQPIALNDNLTVDLKESMWPCELHMQRMRLRQVYAQRSESEFRNTVKIKRKFTALFGACDQAFDEDFEGPYSPSIELADPILLGSCLKRIAPWVVKHLMVPMRRGLIADRYLFKKLAKHIAEGVLAVNQYPGENCV